MNDREQFEAWRKKDHPDGWTDFDVWKAATEAARATPAQPAPMPAILALAQIGEALGTDEDEGGPAPILEAIAGMKWREKAVSDLMRDWKTANKSGDDVCVALFRLFSSTPVMGADPAPSPATDVSAPSPSSVGDAIRAMPLPYVKVSPNGAQTQWGRDMANCGAEAMREHIIALLPKILSI